MNNQIFTKELIFDRIKDSGYPFWSLALVQGFKNYAHVMSYFGNDFEDNDTFETQIDKSIKRLDNAVSSFPENSVFSIEIKNSKQANGAGIIGPFQFSNSYEPEKVETSQTPLNGVVPSGYVPESMLKGVEERLKLDFENQLEKFKIQTKREQQEDEIKRRIAELDEREKNLKDLEKGYSSSVAKSADVISEVGKRLLGYFFPDISTIGGASQAQGFEPPQPTLGNPQPTDEKAEAAENLAEYVYNNFDAQQINKFFETLKKAKDDAELLKKNTNVSE